ncbi:hypothetical protein [Desulfobulbus sp.]|uniref:hypothetical protein n=1 Tax=Desulfobulbus sp. TaxID=895 RepID=UPI0027B9C779|nr:hypothetical protein [Desulfobulbus sp.]
MNRIIFHTFAFILLATTSNAAIENLDEMAARKERRATNTYYSGESAGNGWNRQPESLMYADTRTGNEVWVLSNTPNKSNVYYTDISPANPWSADGARVGFFSNRPVSEFTRTAGSSLDAAIASTFTVNTDGSHLRAAYDSSERTYSSSGTQYFYWSPVIPNTYYTTGGRFNGQSLDSSAIYKNTVTDKGTIYSKLVDLPGVDSDYYGMKKIISPDGQYLLPKKDGKYFPVRVHPEASAGMLDTDGWAEYRGQLNQFAGGDPFGCRHDIYFPSPDFIVILYSNDCNSAQPILYKLNIKGTDPDGGPAFDDAELKYANFGDFETEPLWNYMPPRVPWKLEPTNMKHWWGHPGFDRWGRTVTFGDGNGYQLINGNLYEFGGPVTWDYKARKLEAQPAGTLLPQVLVNKGASYNDHNAWSDYFALSNTGAGKPEEDQWVGTAEYNKTAANKNDFRMVSYHYQNQNGSTSYTWTSNNRIAQSPDGTKISYAITFLTNIANTGDLAYAVAHYPHPPEITSVTDNSGAYTVRFDWRLGTATPRGYTKRGWPNEATDNPPPPRETKLFRVWRSCDKVDDWKPLGTVNADIFSRYDFSTGQWKGNDYWEFTDDSKPSGTCYYAVTAQEHSGLESRTLSNVLSTTGTQTSEYPSDPKGAKPFYLVAPQWPKPTVSKLSTPGQYRLDWEEPANAMIRYYNIYYSTDPIPKAIQSQRIASVPKGTNTYVDWLAHPTSEGHYLITSVDSQGNESSLARRMLTP